MAIYSGFTHWKWWFSIVMLVYQRVTKDFSHLYVRICSDLVHQRGQVHVTMPFNLPVSSCEFRGVQQITFVTSWFLRFLVNIPFLDGYYQHFLGIYDDLWDLILPTIFPSYSMLFHAIPVAGARPQRHHRGLHWWPWAVGASNRQRNGSNLKSSDGDRTEYINKHVLVSSNGRSDIGMW